MIKIKKDKIRKIKNNLINLNVINKRKKYISD